MRIDERPRTKGYAEWGVVEQLPQNVISNLEGERNAMIYGGHCMLNLFAGICPGVKMLRKKDPKASPHG